MTVTILFTDAAGVLQTLEADATVRELHTGTAVPTEHPMETGVDLTDHVRPERARLSVDWFVTNTPVRAVGGVLPVRPVKGQMQLTKTERVLVSPAQVRGGPFPTPLKIPGAPTLSSPVQVTPAVRQDVQTITAGNVLQFPTRFDRVKDVCALLESLRRAGTQLKVVTSLREYESMVITSRSEPKEAHDAVTISLELVEVQYASSEIVDAPVPLERRAAKQKPQGPKAPYELPPTERTSSLARSALLKTAGIGG